jgi:hypothetical protein
MITLAYQPGIGNDREWEKLSFPVECFKSWAGMFIRPISERKAVASNQPGILNISSDCG